MFSTLISRFVIPSFQGDFVGQAAAVYPAYGNYGYGYPAAGYGGHGRFPQYGGNYGNFGYGYPAGGKFGYGYH